MGSESAASAVSVSDAERNIAFQTLRVTFADVPLRAVSGFGQDWVIVPASAIVEACRLLRDHAAMPRAPRWEVVYTFLSLSRNARVRLKVEVEDGPTPEVPTVSAVYPSANWYEREIYDLMGIRFSDHPDLRRILLPDDWQGYPLRFDHPLGGEEVGFTS
jgi:NADH-quinone oxidoreductase subunit C